jgi:uncharacterized protein YceH (UPF0502 family)
MNMDSVLDDTEVRILGCLIEKEMTTPEYYPLSLNALTNACNQKSNRDPVVSYDDNGVTRGLHGLQEKGLARKTNTPGSRVPKYLHTILDRFDLATQEMAILCELMLRGPQTAGEIRTRAERMSAFESLEAVERTLQGLMDHDPPLAMKLPRETGRKECRYIHLFSGDTGIEKTVHDASSGAPSQSAAHERITRLEKEAARLGTELEELKRAFAEFKSQF